MNHILSICLNPVIQKTIVLENLMENEVNRSKEHYQTASGKGVNVTRVITQSKGAALHLTHAGGQYKNLFLDLCLKDDVTVCSVDSHSEIRSCYTLLNRKAKTTTEIVEEALPVSSGTEEKIKELYLELLQETTIVIISGTKAPGYSPSLYPWMTKEAVKKNKPVILDIKGEDLLACLSASPSIIKPNFSEFMATFTGKNVREHNLDPRDLKEAEEKMKELFDSYGCKIILTRGKGETLYFDQQGYCSFKPKKIERIVNTTGCGDAFTGGLAKAMEDEKPMIDCIKQGHEWAALNAESLLPGWIKY